MEEHKHHNHEYSPEVVPMDLPPREPLTSKRWQQIAEKGNGISAFLQAGAWAFTGQAGALIDAFHNWTDKIGYKKEGQNLHNLELNEQQRLRNRRIVHWLFFTTSLALGTKAGIEIITDNEPGPDKLSLYSGGVSVALSSFLLAGLGKGMLRRRKTHPDKETRYTATEKMRIKHVLKMDVPSAVLSLAGAIGQYHHPSAGNAAGMASGALGMWLFVPTPENIGHDCHDHESEQSHEHSCDANTNTHHEHEDVPHEQHGHTDHAHHAHEHHSHSPEPRPKWRNRLRRRVAAGALAFGALASTVVLASDSTYFERQPAKQAQEQQYKQPDTAPLRPITPIAPEAIPFTPPTLVPVEQTPQDTVTAQTVMARNNTLTIHKTNGAITSIEGALGAGENPWSITEDAITATGKQPTPQATTAANPFMTPDKQSAARTIQPGTAFRWNVQDEKLVPVA